MMKEIENKGGGGGGNKADMCREFARVISMNQTIWKNRTKIISMLEQNGLRIKGFQTPGRTDIDRALLKWFKQGRSDTVPVSSPLLQTTFNPPKFLF
jgi:hypothetical protein